MTLDIVHVRDERAGTCRPALVLAVYAPPPGSYTPELRLRVIRPTGIGQPAGAADDEATYRHDADATTVLSPDGTFRRLDSWHLAGAGYSRHPLDPFRDFDAPAGAGAAVEAERGQADHS